MFYLPTLLLFFLLSKTPASVAQTVALDPIVSGFSLPLAYIEDPLGGDRKFVVEKRGIVHIVVNDGAEVLSDPFLDVSDIVSQAINEGGLLGLAFHPNYEQNGFFFISYTTNGPISVLRRLGVSPSDPNIAEVGNDNNEIIFELDQPFQNHNGGQILFGPNDGLLYYFLGDGGSGGDPNNFAQNRKSYYGKILRLKVTTGAKAKYKIPGSNPYKKHKKFLPEILHYGLRNPWRNSFDKANGDLFIGDVGQNAIEEISFAKKGKRGFNFGWRLKEGDACFNPSSNCQKGKKLKDPILTYRHNGGDCSVTGGYVYRGSEIPELVGKYIYGDFCSGRIRVGTKANKEWTSETLLETDATISSFGEDSEGELYVVDYGGTIYKIVPV